MTDGVKPTYSGGPTKGTLNNITFADNVQIIITTDSTNGMSAGDPITGSGIATGTTITGIKTSGGGFHGTTTSTLTLSNATILAESAVSLSVYETVGSSGIYSINLSTTVSGNGVQSTTPAASR